MGERHSRRVLSDHVCNHSSRIGQVQARMYRKTPEQESQAVVNRSRWILPEQLWGLSNSLYRGISQLALWDLIFCRVAPARYFAISPVVCGHNTMQGGLEKQFCQCRHSLAREQLTKPITGQLCSSRTVARMPPPPPVDSSTPAAASALSSRGKYLKRCYFNNYIQRVQARRLISAN